MKLFNVMICCLIMNKINLVLSFGSNRIIQKKFSQYTNRESSDTLDAVNLNKQDHGGNAVAVHNKIERVAKSTETKDSLQPLVNSPSNDAVNFNDEHEEVNAENNQDKPDIHNNKKYAETTENHSQSIELRLLSGNKTDINDDSRLTRNENEDDSDVDGRTSSDELEPPSNDITSSDYKTPLSNESPQNTYRIKQNISTDHENRVILVVSSNVFKTWVSDSFSANVSLGTSLSLNHKIDSFSSAIVVISLSIIPLLYILYNVFVYLFRSIIPL